MSERTPCNGTYRRHVLSETGAQESGMAIGSNLQVSGHGNTCLSPFTVSAGDRMVHHPGRVLDIGWLTQPIRAHKAGTAQDIRVMQGAIVSQFKPVRTVLRQLIKSIDPLIAVWEKSDVNGIEGMIQAHGPAFIFMSLPSAADGGIQVASQIKANFPDINLAVMVRYDYPEYMAISKTLEIDHLLSEENMDRQVIKRIVTHPKTQRGWVAHAPQLTETETD